MDKTASCAHTVVHIKVTVLKCQKSVSTYLWDICVYVCYTGKSNFMKTPVEATTSNSKTTLVLTSKHVDSSIRMDYLRAYR